MRNVELLKLAPDVHTANQGQMFCKGPLHVINEDGCGTVQLLENFRSLYKALAFMPPTMSMSSFWTSGQLGKPTESTNVSVFGKL